MFLLELSVYCNISLLSTCHHHLRETASLKHKDEKIMDLKDQIRDVRIYMDAQKTLANTDDVKGARFCQSN